MLEVVLMPWFQVRFSHWSDKKHSGWLGNQGLMPGMGEDLFKASRLALGPTQPSIPWVPGVLSLGVKGQDKNLNTHRYRVSG